MEGKIEKD